MHKSTVTYILGQSQVYTNPTTGTIEDSEVQIYNFFSIPDSWKQGDLLLTSLSIGIGVTLIGQLACSGCVNLTGECFIPDTVTSIGAGAFDGCSMLGTLNIPSSVSIIGSNAFRDNNFTQINMRKLTPPSIGSNIFSGMQVTEIHVPANSTGYEAAFPTFTIVYDL